MVFWSAHDAHKTGSRAWEVLGTKEGYNYYGPSKTGWDPQMIRYSMVKGGELAPVNALDKLAYLHDIVHYNNGTEGLMASILSTNKPTILSDFALARGAVSVLRSGATGSIARTALSTSMGMYFLGGMHTMAAYSYYWLISMRPKNILIYAITSAILSSCITIQHANWSSSTYDPEIHTFKVDSADFKRYGKEEVERSIRKGWADGWIVDSIAYFNFYIEQEKSTMPIIPIFYRLRYHKQNALYNFQVSVRNNKTYKSLDTVSYTIYDSLETVCYKGGYNYNLNIAESKPYELFKTPFLIDVQLKETDIIYGDVELVFTDDNGNQMTQTIQKLKFKYKEGKYFTSDINY